MIVKSIFSAALKLANTEPVLKTASRTSKENYRSVIFLPNVTKIHESLIFIQINGYFEGLFSKYQCGFRKGLSAWKCLIAMLEKWKKFADKRKKFSVLLTELPKAFDCLPHDLLIAKPKAYFFSLSSTRIIHSYLFDRKQRTKTNSVYSWEEIISSIL